eukprot:INCI5381.4.p2 GENE.INCI5381.4~~INCI5381.4.p2  ORF type:complete len:205 (+),score=35.29 INCI5381.4:850-1464(+)
MCQVAVCSHYDEYNERFPSVPSSAESTEGLPSYYDLWAQLAKLQAFENFQLVGLVEHGNLKRGGHVIEMKPKYVHSKLCIVDGTWTTLGSANFVDISFLEDHTELNVAWTSKPHSLAVLQALVHHHTDHISDSDTGRGTASEGACALERTAPDDIALVKLIASEARYQKSLQLKAQKTAQQSKKRRTVIALDAMTYAAQTKYKQ